MLRVITEGGARDLPLHRRTAVSAGFGRGFYDEERDPECRFRWMSGEGRITLGESSRDRFLELWVFSPFKDTSQVLSLGEGDGAEERVLPHGWNRLSIPIAPGDGEIGLRVDRLFPRSFYPGDERTLAVRIRGDAFAHEDRGRHAHVHGQYANRLRNWQEMLAGQVELESSPTTLGIDMHGVCNVKPPCVYCDWDTSKEMEGEMVSAPFTRETLNDWGDLFTHAQNLVNCSIGEPFMMKNFDELLDLFGNQGKTLEMTTNGQILTDRNIEKLLGRDIDLYISLDAATAETYARLRNDTFDKILVNLRRLIEAKSGGDGLPRIHLVFMPMRCNRHEVGAFVELCAELGVDRLVLRPLNFSEGIALKWERAGYVFDYPRELLPFDELIEISRQVARLCREHGVPLSDQLDFGGALAAQFADADVEPQAPAVEPVAAPVQSEPSVSLGEEKLPACTEPWSSFYILRRGILPCCYGGHPIAPMDGFEGAWNSNIVQEIRGELAAGRFHRYCLRSPACPIVRKDSHAGILPGEQAAFLRVRDALQRLNRRLGGVPGRVYRQLARGARRLSKGFSGA